MARNARPDLSQLATLAQMPGQDLRATVLLGQAELFAESIRRDAATVAAFEALALGLIPLVDDATVAQMADRLHAVVATPEAVRLALASRLSRQAAEPISHLRLDGHRLAELVERARHDLPLARSLLARPEPSVFDRAVLYRFASPDERVDIRTALARRLPVCAVTRSGLSDLTRTMILAGNAALPLAVRMAAAGIGPSRDAVIDGFAGVDSDQELFALGLLALGFRPDECVSLLLAMPPGISHSVAVIGRLADLVRTTPLAVAIRLADPDQRIVELREPSRAAPQVETSGRTPRASSARSPSDPRVVSHEGPERIRRYRGANGLPDHRWLATTGPGRI